MGRASNDGAASVERFTAFERAAHWSNAIAFCALAISGIVMARGKFFLLPVLGGHEVSPHRFDAGEKQVLWGDVLVLGLVVVASGLGLNLLVPGLGETQALMRIASMVHSVASVLMMAMFASHIYIGTVGMRGAYKAMRTGFVDAAWAEEHHKL